jgi:uncharacterized membrane protein
MLLVFAFTGDVVLSSGVGLAEIFLKSIIYFVHERVWNAIGFGRVKR